MVHAIPALRFQQQADPHWCWAAVTWMVLDFYTQRQCGLQCQIASQVTGGNCCPSPSSGPNDPCRNLINLRDALDAVGHSAGPMLPQPQPLFLVRDELDAQHPICAQIALPGVNHYAVLSACTDEGAIRVLDPLGWYDTDFTTFTQFNPQSPRGFCTGWFLTK
jgi:hypothetical protein